MMLLMSHSYWEIEFLVVMSTNKMALITT